MKFVKCYIDRQVLVVECSVTGVVWFIKHVREFVWNVRTSVECEGACGVEEVVCFQVFMIWELDGCMQEGK